MKEAPSVDYKLPNISKPKWLLYGAALFVAAFFMYFPVGEKTESMARKTLSSLPGCPISYDSMNFSWLLPKLVIEDLEIPSSCFNQRGAPLVLDKTHLYIRGISFSPVGPHFKLATTFMDNPIEALITTGVTGDLEAAIDGTTIDLSKISPMLPAGIALSGQTKINMLAQASPAGLSNLDLKVASKNFALPAQTIQAFAFSRMNINNLLLKADLEQNGNLRVEEVVIGDAQSPIRANFKGMIKMNNNMPAMSNLNLTGEVAFSEKFLEEYSIIGMFMNRFDKKDEFYQIQITGTVAQPNFSSPGNR